VATVRAGEATGFRSPAIEAVRNGRLAPTESKSDQPQDEQHRGGDPQRVQGKSQPSEDQDQQESARMTIVALFLIGGVLTGDDVPPSVVDHCSVTSEVRSDEPHQR
jgi:hypothetical protein